MFNWIVNDADSEPTRYNEIARSSNNRLGERHKKLFGFATSGTGATSRDNLYSNVMFEALRTGGANMNDNVLISQILSLVSKNGRVDHAVGKHDDMVISWLMCYWFITQGKNLGYYKGMDTFKLLRSIPSNVNVKMPTLEEMYLKEQQDRFRTEIRTLSDQLQQTRDSSAAFLLSERIDLLEHQIIMERDEIKTMSDMVNMAKENHTKLRSSNSEYNASSHFKTQQQIAKSSPASGWARLLRR